MTEQNKTIINQSSKKLDVSLKAISFSLWKDNEDDKLGAIANAIYAHYTFSGWDCIFYIPEGYDEETVLRLSDMDWVKVHRIPECRKDDDSPILSKFLAASLDIYDYIIFRSCKARLIKRDAIAVQEWIRSGKNFHIIYDNPQLGFIPECSWGVRGGVIKNAINLVTGYMNSAARQPWLNCVNKNEKGELVWDAIIGKLFVQNIIFPLSQQSYLRHDELSRDINGDRIGLRIDGNRSFDSPYVGEIITHLETPLQPELRIMLHSKSLETTETLMENMASQEMNHNPHHEEQKDKIFEEQYQNIKKINGAI